jgi:hypothetical protein
MSYAYSFRAILDALALDQKLFREALVVPGCLSVGEETSRTVGGWLAIFDGMGDEGTEVNQGVAIKHLSGSVSGSLVFVAVLLQRKFKKLLNEKFLKKYGTCIIDVTQFSISSFACLHSFDDSLSKQPVSAKSSKFQSSPVPHPNALVHS